MTNAGPPPGQADAKTSEEAVDADLRSSPAKTRPSQDVGQYLRDAYREAIDEGVPDDLMDLLRKLD